MNTIITGLGLALLGACIGIGGHAAGVAWGKTRRCPTAWTIRILCGLVVYGVVGLMTTRGFATLAEAQSFPRDSQTVITGRQARTQAQSLDEEQLREIATLMGHMYEQRVTNSQTLGRLNGHDDRLKAIEAIKPDTVALRLDGLESTMKLGIGLLVTIFGAMVVQLLVSWMKRPKGSEGA